MLCTSEGCAGHTTNTDVLLSQLAGIKWFWAIRFRFLSLSCKSGCNQFAADSRNNQVKWVVLDHFSYQTEQKLIYLTRKDDTIISQIS